MKGTIEQRLQDAVQHLKQSGVVPSDLAIEIKLDHTKDKTHGDYASNLALILAKPCGQAPRKIAELLVQTIQPSKHIEKIEIAGPGFINFFVKAEDRAQIIADILQKQDQFGYCDLGQGQKIILEYVSANPTGPLHVGHGRGAAFGASLANLLVAAGYQVSREYYVNDAGRQMNILAVSVWLRYLELGGESIIFPSNGYRGEYVHAIAKSLMIEQGKTYLRPWSLVVNGLPPDEPEGGDKEQYIDALIHKAQQLLGIDGFSVFHQHALHSVLGDIKNDLAEFGVDFDAWFSEQSLSDDGSIAQGIQDLKAAGCTYEQGGALWFKATAFGDEKDRVLVRANGQTTYFASDVAYHWNKYHRGFTRIIDVFGADHHGYISRIKSSIKALGHDESTLDILLVQFAILYRGQERVQMSTRSGSFVTLRELREEVGNDAARFFYVLRKSEQHMDFDLDLAKSQSSDNPVYYIQYAHARISSVLRQLKERGLHWDETQGIAQLALLQAEHEQALIATLSRYQDMIQEAAMTCEPHQIAYYLRELANGLHSYYNAVTILSDQENLRSARLCLLKAVRQVLQNGLQLLGVSAPESM